ncbi:hypothetical protein [Desulfosporosinus nitroreducens]|uniref:Uncharacterized protein n=1 Tax=Desulfosporosinus nitroreducens TaxID=2018668 RepID=A0ABT8QX81_9FIRM|nr:hypothetical protein [Desulfosporosinus nitroreducens]MDO0825953.1 hypothetical protein [Desulfosporosinus nitroreducens]
MLGNEGNEVAMPEYKGKVLLFVNNCGFLLPSIRAWSLLKPDLAGNLIVAEVTPE